MTSPFHQYLSNLKSCVLNSSDQEHFHVVLGNESCDLDSVSCAMAFAYYLHSTAKKSTGQCYYIPVLNISRADYRLKTEVKYMIKMVNVEDSNLIFRDDIDLKSLSERGRLKLTLVDFNTFQKELECLDKCVVQVIDHHLKRRENSRKVNMTIESVGSCASLVAQILMKNKKFVSPKEITLLLYSSILIDTRCLEDKTTTTKKDIKIVDKLHTTLVGVNRRDLYSEVLEAKLDLTGLSRMEMLRKDLKVLKKEERNKSLSISISVVNLSLFQFFKDEEVFGHFFDEFLKSTNSQVCVIMFLQILGDLAKRYLALYSPNELLLDKLINVIKSQQNPCIFLEDIEPSTLPQTTGNASQLDISKLYLAETNVSTAIVARPTASKLTLSSEAARPNFQSTFAAFKQNNPSASRKVLLNTIENSMVHLMTFL